MQISPVEVLGGGGSLMKNYPPPPPSASPADRKIVKRTKRRQRREQLYLEAVWKELELTGRKLPQQTNLIESESAYRVLRLDYICLIV